MIVNLKRISEINYICRSQKLKKLLKKWKNSKSKMILKKNSKKTQPTKT